MNVFKIIPPIIGPTIGASRPRGSKPCVIRLPDPFGGKERVGISARGQINRMDWGLNWDGVAGTVPFASHTIKLEVDSEIVVKVGELAQAS